MITFARCALSELAERHGGVVRGGVDRTVARVVSVERADEGDLAPLLSRRFVPAAVLAASRGAALLVDESTADHPEITALEGVWVHAHATWALAHVLDAATTVLAPARVGDGCVLGDHVVLAPGVVLGDRVRVDANTVIGRAGFGWAFGPGGAVRAVPQLGGVVIEDDVVIGPLCSIDAGTLSPTRIRRGAKLDAQVHVGHNVDIGEGTIVAAQSGFAGSVVVGRGVLVGGQVGVADHVTIGDGARIAAKSGVIGDVPRGAVVAGYPAQPRQRFFRALARLYKGLR